MACKSTETARKTAHIQRAHIFADLYKKKVSMNLEIEVKVVDVANRQGVLGFLDSRKESLRWINTWSLRKFWKL